MGCWGLQMLPVGRRTLALSIRTLLQQSSARSLQRLSSRMLVKKLLQKAVTTLAKMQEQAWHQTKDWFQTLLCSRQRLMASRLYARQSR